MQQASNESGQEAFLWHKDGYLAYDTVMFYILTIGFVGNGLTLNVWHQREHRNHSVNSLMMNLALEDIFIFALSYPIAIQARGEVSGQVSMHVVCLCKRYRGYSVHRNPNWNGFSFALWPEASQLWY